MASNKFQPSLLACKYVVSLETTVVQESHILNGCSSSPNHEYWNKHSNVNEIEMSMR